MIDELRSGGDRARWVSRATPRRVQGSCLSKWYRARAADLLAVGEVVRICALELALEEPIELRIARRLLTVLDTEGIGLGLRVKISPPLERTIIRTVLRGCWQKIWANLIISCEFSFLERSIIMSALFC